MLPPATPIFIIFVCYNLTIISINFANGITTPTAIIGINIVGLLCLLVVVVCSDMGWCTLPAPPKPVDYYAYYARYAVLYKDPATRVTPADRHAAYCLLVTERDPARRALYLRMAGDMAVMHNVNLLVFYSDTPGLTDTRPITDCLQRMIALGEPELLRCIMYVTKRDMYIRDILRGLRTRYPALAREVGEAMAYVME
jgi:hypothetical protein